MGEFLQEQGCNHPQIYQVVLCYLPEVVSIHVPLCYGFLFSLQP